VFHAHRLKAGSIVSQTDFVDHKVVLSWGRKTIPCILSRPRRGPKAKVVRPAVPGTTGDTIPATNAVVASSANDMSFPSGVTAGRLSVKERRMLSGHASVVSGASGMNDPPINDGEQCGGDEARLREHWPERTWRKSREGNWYLNADGFNLVVSGKGGAWTVFVQNRETEQAQAGRKSYPTLEAAKLAAFEALMWARRHL
jgi:hypothetical protein